MVIMMMVMMTMMMMMIVVIHGCGRSSIAGSNADDVRATARAQVRVALAHRQETRTMFGVALRAAFAASEAVDAVRRTTAVLLAEVSVSHTFAFLVAWLPWMVAWVVRVYLAAVRFARLFSIPISACFQP